MSSAPIIRYGEPRLIATLWRALYLVFMPIGTLLWLYGSAVALLQMPLFIRVVIVAISGLVLTVLVIALRSIFRIDSFVLDHPLVARSYESRVVLIGALSKLSLTVPLPCVIRRLSVPWLSSWIVLEVRLAGKRRALWFSPTFVGRESLLRRLAGE